MDPETTLRDAEAHLAAGERAEAADALERYWAWRRGCGFEPRAGDGDRDARALGRRLACGGLDGDGDKGGGEADGPVPLADAVATILARLPRRGAAADEP
jgi:hypothetical protein